MDRLRRAIELGEDWLLERVVDHAERLGCNEYTSTLEQAWRASICGLSEPITQALEAYEEPPELAVPRDVTRHPICRLRRRAGPEAPRAASRWRSSWD